MIYNHAMTIGTPHRFGFADSGEEWEKFGGSKALISYLEELDPTGRLRDWLSYGKFAEERYPEEHEFSIDTIYPIQDYLNLSTVENYRRTLRNGVTSSFNYAFTGDIWEKYPVLMLIKGKTFIFQGTHRLAALSLEKNTKYLGYFLDFEKESLLVINS